eukprot:TRINITY_DN2163_c0_g2_i1.p1 TRINITY_DN2163_c0_g2~~TRINITY_DN2163_c0_g2_i1.p1  ORF type:complete len:1860 (+),score=588.60 TRINITY_DN2163_c0_g2_i1:96-5675(+)
MEEVVHDSKSVVEPEEVEEESVVGSIQHVLQTAFSEFYKNEEDVEEVDEDNEITDESTEKVEETEAKDPEPSPKEPKKKGKATEIAENDEENEEEEEEIEEPKPPTKEELIEKEYAELGILDHVKAVNNMLNDQLSLAETLEKHLKSKLSEVKDIDQESQNTLREMGLILGCEVPVQHNTVKWDKQVLGGADLFGSLLIDAKDLVFGHASYIEERSAKVQAARAFSRQAETSNYLKSTMAQDNRRKQIASTLPPKHPKLTKKLPKSSKDNSPTSSSPSPKKNKNNKSKKRAPQMSIEEEKANKEVQRKMDMFSSFKKNPRHQDVKAMDLGQTLANPESAPLFSELKRTEESAMFVVEPSQLAFDNFEIGQVIEKRVYFRNKSPLTRSITLLPPQTPDFHISSIKYPSKKQGAVAPGMSVCATIRFEPHSLSTKEDFIVFCTQADNYRVRLSASRDAPVLDLVSELDCGSCYAGLSIEKKFTVTNTGGKGVFRLLRPNQYPDIPNDFASEELILGNDIFKLSPTEFSLKHGESIQLNTIFRSPETKECIENFLIYADSEEVVEYSIKAESCCVDVCLQSVHNVPLRLDAVPSQMEVKTLPFPKTVPGQIVEQKISVRNNARLALPFRWQEIPDCEELTTQGSLRWSEDMELPISNPPTSLIQVSPANGTFDSYEELEFTFQFSPSNIGSWKRRMCLVLEGVSYDSASQFTRVLTPSNDNSTPPLLALADDEGNMPPTPSILDIRPLGFEVVGRSSYADGQIVMSPFLNFPPTIVGATVKRSVDVTNSSCGDVSCKLHVKSDRGMWPCSISLADGGHVSIPAGATKSVDVAITFHDPLPQLPLTPASAVIPSAKRNSFTPLSSSIVNAAYHNSVYNNNNKSNNKLPPVKFTGLVTCNVSSCAMPLSSKIQAEIARPSIAVESSTLAFGLMPVGASETRQFIIRNNGPCPATYTLEAPSSQVTETPSLSMSEVGSVVSSSIGGGSSVAGSVVFGRRSGCNITFSKEHGTLLPDESITIDIICNAGTVPERFRGLLQCHVSGGDSRCISLGAEVQSPKVALSVSVIEFGTVFVNVPVSAELEISNLSNLPASFKFDEMPNPDDCGYRLSVDKPSATLKSQENLKLKVDLMPLRPGRCDITLGCDIHGVKLPLALYVGALIKGLVVSYDVLETDPSLGDVKPEHTHHGDLSNIPRLDFGSVPIFERKTLWVRIINESCVPAPVTFALRKFGRKDGGSPSMRKLRNGNPVLAPAKDLTRFRSSSGRSHVGRQAVFNEDRKALSSAGDKGIAFSLQADGSTLEPNSSIVTSITLHNNLPGRYLDSVDVCVGNLAPTALPVKVEVTGCPLALSRNCAGLHFGPVGPPSLNWGDVPCSTNAPARTLVIRNRAPNAVRMRWSLSHRNNDIPPISLKLAVSDDPKSPLNVSIRMAGDTRPPPSFVISPEEAEVPPQGSSSFTVSFNTPEDAEQCEAFIEAEMQLAIVPPSLSMGVLPRKTSITAASRQTASTANLRRSSVPGIAPLKCLRVDLNAASVTPTLTLDKPSMSDGTQCVAAHVYSTDNPKSSPNRFRKQFTLTNSQTTSLTFSLSINGGDNFRLLRSKSDAPIHPLRLGKSSFQRSLRPSSPAAHMYTLPSGGAVKVEMAFMPRLTVEELTVPVEPAPILERRFKDEMVVRFSNGHLQKIALKGAVERPFIMVTPNLLSFPVCRVDASITLTLFLTNPTSVPAKWRIEHAKVRGISAQQRKLQPLISEFLPTFQAQSTNQPIDDPSAFEFGIMNGILDGPTVPASALESTVSSDLARRNEETTQILSKTSRRLGVLEPTTLAITFRPSKSGMHLSRFRLIVEGGPGFEFALNGKATLREESKF